jgi:outer membrane protein assembly factor BamB
LTQYVTAMRRQRRWYFLIVGGIVAIAVVVVAVVMATSEISHVQLRTATSAAPQVQQAELNPTPKMAWQSSDATAIGEPFYQGTVVTSSAHAAVGRNALTGAIRWSYTRTDRVVCTVTQQQGKTLAIFAKDGNCDEVTTLDTATGKRLGVRTLVDNGHPAYTALPDTLVITTPDAVHAIDPASGYDRWLYQQPDGCRTTGAALGAGGALIGQQCADGGHLLLRDRYASSDDKNTQVKWRLSGVNSLPLAAEDMALALDPSTGDLVSYDLARGSVKSRSPMSPRPVPGAAVAQLATTTAELIQIGETTYAVTPTGAKVLWTASTRGLPTVNPGEDEVQPPPLVGATVLAGSASGVVSLDGSTGSVKRTFSVPAPSNGGRVFPVGTGFLVAGSRTQVYQ